MQAALDLYPILSESDADLRQPVRLAPQNFRHMPSTCAIMCAHHDDGETVVSVQGETPPMQAALDLYHILSESDTDLRQPVGLEKQLLQGQSLDEDVGQSMLQLLQVRLDCWHTVVSKSYSCLVCLRHPCLACHAIQHLWQSLGQRRRPVHAATVTGQHCTASTILRQNEQVSNNWQGHKGASCFLCCECCCPATVRRLMTIVGTASTLLWQASNMRQADTGISCFALPCIQRL